MNDQQNLTPDNELLALMRKQAEFAAKREVREAKAFEQKEAEEREAKENRQRRVDTQKHADAQMWIAQTDWQRRCDHRKGTSGKKKWRHIDYNVGRHTFQNGVTQIKCFKCRMKWYPGDTAEACAYNLDNYMKGNKKIKFENPTKLSYAKAYEMTLDENTTNTETRSEMITQGPVPVTA